MTSAQALPQIGLATTRADLVAESIRSAILNGTLKPGDVLVERQLAAQLGVSKTPVREAMIGLANTKLLVSSRNRGMTVRRLTLTEIRHVYEERLLLEPWAVRRVVEAGISDFSDALGALQESEIRADNQAARVMANRRFHRALYSRCENELVVEALDGLQDMVALAAVTVFWERWGTGDKEAGEHKQILDAAANGDAEGAESLLRAHIQASIERAASTD